MASLSKKAKDALAKLYSIADKAKISSIVLQSLSQFDEYLSSMSIGVARVVSEGITAGESMTDISQALHQTVVDTTTRANRIARTEVINASVEAARQRYIDLGIEEVRVICCADACPKCVPHSERVYKVDDVKNLPVYHPNCRCAIAAVVPRRRKE